MFKFRPAQLAAASALKWLTSNELDMRNTGRTTLVAIALLDAAKDNKGTWVYAFDHSLTNSNVGKEFVIENAKVYAKQLHSKDVFEFDNRLYRLRYLETRPTITLA